MFNKIEIKKFIIEYGKKWLFPDFTNKLTWLVVSIGGAILLTPTALKQIIYNWLVDTVNLNAGTHFTLAQLQSNPTEYIIGFSLVVLSLAHNIANRYITYKSNSEAIIEIKELNEVDKKLFQCFLTEFSSSCHSVNLLQEHDFGGAYHTNGIKQIESFVNTWNTAEKEFLNHKLESKRKELWDKCNTFVHKLALNSYRLNGSDSFSCIPDAYRDEWDWPEHVNIKIKELNDMASECYQLHREFVILSRRTLKC